ncbi:hypothetical protein BGZ65_002885 [Modicella reniformis]|uniref:Uncharacterized protein n=1 Tax=Modicella reniformis TaxID=1440133 RepID=A0A9P6MM29_9FUNG|nr:hypothetical protein BGZ65_002885 [Modicella reniformis]
MSGSSTSNVSVSAISGATTVTSASTSPESYQKQASSWRFPTSSPPDGGWNNNTTVPVQVWTSTSEALSQLYNSLNQIKIGRPQASASVLQSALLHYNYLSRLQSMYDTILVPRRETRTLFMSQGRQPKTGPNLEQLLRIAVDLIWLNEKDRQRNRRATSTSTKSVLYQHSHADDYHGLRVSEYTILMNWIGSVTTLPGVDQIHTRNQSDTSVLSSTSLSRSAYPSSPLLTHGEDAQEDRSSVVVGESLDRVWRIWQDFLLTGMKPDVVLYTMLMEKLLRDKEYSRASQIWGHMHQCAERDSKDDSNEDGLRPKKDLNTLKESDPVSKTLNKGAKSAPLVGNATLGELEKPSALDLLDNHNQSLRSVDKRPTTAPNTQTFSVLMQTHVLDRDLKGVTQTYQELLRTVNSRDETTSDGPVASSTIPPASPQQLPGLHSRVNTVLLNQILKVLIDLNEINTTKEIYTAMKKPEQDSDSSNNLGIDRNLPYVNERATVTNRGSSLYSIDAFLLPRSDSSSQPSPTEPASGPATEQVISIATTPKHQKPTIALSLIPVHHQTSSRRSTWRHKARKDNAAIGPADRLSASSIQPDETTLKLMLELARQNEDRELEEVVLEDAYTFGLLSALSK